MKTFVYNTVSSLENLMAEVVRVQGHLSDSADLSRIQLSQNRFISGLWKTDALVDASRLELPL